MYRAGLDEESKHKVVMLLAAKDLEVAQRLAEVNKDMGENRAVIAQQAGRLGQHAKELAEVRLRRRQR